jgi:DNA invertase Pin-like site-specific DNA recombinase
MDRPGMRALKEAIAAGRIKVVVIFKLERVLRSTDEWSSFRSFLKKHNCRLESVSEGEAADTAAGRLKSNIIISVAEYERLNLGEKVSNKMLKQAQRGQWNGGMIPFGYIYDLKEKILRPDPIEAPLVRYLYSKAAELITMEALAEEFNARSLRTKKRTFRSRDGNKREVGGLRFRSDWLRKVIRNPIYRGAIRYNGEEYAGQHEALVSAEVWEAANAAVNQTIQPALCQTPSVGRDRNFNLLKGLAFCGECSRALVPQASGKLDPQGQRYRYYTCCGVLRERTDSKCGLRRVSAVGLERAVIRLLGQLSRHPSVVEAVLAAGRRGKPARLAELAKRVAVVDSEIDQVTKRVQNLLDTLAKGGLAAIDDELREEVAEWKLRKAPLLLERAQIHQEIGALQQAQLAPETVCAALKQFDRLWEAIPQEEKREVATLLIAKVEVHPQTESTSASASNARSLKLRVLLNLPNLLGAAEGAKKVVAIDAAVVVPSNNGAIVITKPLQYREPIQGKIARSDKKAAKREHPLQRALKWGEILNSTPGLTARALAKRVRVSETTMSMTLQLLRLIQPIRDAVLANLDKPHAYHLGLRVLAKLAVQPPNKQAAEFALLVKRWEPTNRTR